MFWFENAHAEYSVKYTTSIFDNKSREWLSTCNYYLKLCADLVLQRIQFVMLLNFVIRQCACRNISSILNTTVGERLTDSFCKIEFWNLKFEIFRFNIVVLILNQIQNCTHTTRELWRNVYEKLFADQVFEEFVRGFVMLSNFLIRECACRKLSSNIIISILIFYCKTISNCDDKTTKLWRNVYKKIFADQVLERICDAVEIVFWFESAHAEQFRKIYFDFCKLWRHNDRMV